MELFCTGLCTPCKRLNKGFGKMLIEELNRLQNAADDPYSEVGEAFARSDPNIWSLIKVAEDDLNAYLAVQRDTRRHLVVARFRRIFRLQVIPLIPTASWRDLMPQ
ncbi:MAG TPA: hypothetical protein VKA97_08440, partial [Pyrinomonadaceae bacterium]|nr:hypothetical protein [Pyrinomonadaceae bacterium]